MPAPITMVDGAANDSLTLCGNYVGTGAANLGIDVDGGCGGLTADQLIILGNAGGSTGGQPQPVGGFGDHRSGRRADRRRRDRGAPIRSRSSGRPASG